MQRADNMIQAYDCDLKMGDLSLMVQSGGLMAERTAFTCSPFLLIIGMRPDNIPAFTCT
jgi:hypothetical protein